MGANGLGLLWLSDTLDVLKNVAVDRFHTLNEGRSITVGRAASL